MRVAHFLQRYYPALGGSEAYFTRLSRYLAAAGHAVTVFTTTALDLEAFWSRRGSSMPAGIERDNGLEIRRFNLWRCPGRRWLLKALSLFPLRTWQCLTMPCNPISFSMWRASSKRDEPFDVVHAGVFPYAFPIACAARLAHRLNVPLVVTPFLHLGDPDDLQDRTRRAYTTPALLSLLHRAERVFVQTAGERRALLNHGLAQEKIVLQGLGVDPAECTGGDRDRIRHSWQVQPGETVVGHLANNSYEKGTIDLVAAVIRARQQGTPLRLVLAGPEMPNFHKAWNCLGTEQAASILRLGRLDENQKKDFFAGLDVFALPSRSDSFGLVLLEAWANGLPNVAYRAGGIADVIRAGEDGILLRCGDIAGLAEALQRLHEDEHFRRGLGAAGQQRLAREFRWQDKLDLVRRVYEERITSRAR